ncbi:hypothetical protein [Haladaptatus salinisoli]|uniref:hypothetical protein n=1 Tax=Haladaptatus salinisoli TaxID=2884876 RepID=UPI001D09E53C|nr:hypothetical protein [Haladaptatus salinisoli]
MVLLVAAVGIGVFACKSVELLEPEINDLEVPVSNEIRLTPSQHAVTWFISLAGAPVRHANASRYGGKAIHGALSFDAA